LDPGLIKERLRPGRNARDAATRTIGQAASLAHCVIAALDVGRFHWSDDVPAVAQGVGFVLFVLAGAAAVWAMSLNPFFSPVVRIQEERGHHVITAGPYRLVRHPGYVAISVLMLASGVALGSWVSVLPMAVLVLLVLRRTALEDRFLHEHLDGYVEYAQRVRYRLLPGVW
jgi:protein-S-isoprenylcysteine O-methyltransferase Ste14